MFFKKILIQFRFGQIAGSDRNRIHNTEFIFTWLCGAQSFANIFIKARTVQLRFQKNRDFWIEGFIAKISKKEFHSKLLYYQDGVTDSVLWAFCVVLPIQIWIEGGGEGQNIVANP